MCQSRHAWAAQRGTVSMHAVVRGTLCPLDRQSAASRSRILACQHQQRQHSPIASLIENRHLPLANTGTKR